MPSVLRLLSRTGQIFPLLILGLASVELTVRVDDWSRFGVPIYRREASIEDLLIRDASGWHTRPGSMFLQFRVNSHGYRGADVPDSVLRTRPLVIATGASETFGLYEAAGHEWPQQLADSLGSRCGDGPMTVLNAAFVGMTLPTVVQDLRARLLLLHPKVIIYYPTPSQYLFRTVPRAGVVGGAPFEELSPWRPRALARVRDAVKRIIPQVLLEYQRRASTARLRASGDPPFASVPVDRLDSMESQLRVLVGEVRKGRSEPVLVVHQNRFADTSAVVERRWLHALEGQVPKATGEVFMRFEHDAGVREARVAADSGVTLVDPAMTARADRASLFADFAHFTDRGSAVMRAIASALAGPAATKTSRCDEASNRAVAVMREPPRAPV